MSLDAKSDGKKKRGRRVKDSKVPSGGGKAKSEKIVTDGAIIYVRGEPGKEKISVRSPLIHPSLEEAARSRVKSGKGMTATWVKEAAALASIYDAKDILRRAGKDARMQISHTKTFSKLEPLEDRVQVSLGLPLVVKEERETRVNDRSKTYNVVAKGTSVSKSEKKKAISKLVDKIDRLLAKASGQYVRDKSGKMHVVPSARATRDKEAERKRRERAKRRADLARVSESEVAAGVARLFTPAGGAQPPQPPQPPAGGAQPPQPPAGGAQPPQPPQPPAGGAQPPQPPQPPAGGAQPPQVRQNIRAARRRVAQARARKGGKVIPQPQLAGVNIGSRNLRVRVPTTRSTKQFDKTVSHKAHATNLTALTGPLSRSDIAKLIKQRNDLLAGIVQAASLYQDQVQAAKFMATVMKGRTKKFPKEGFSIPKIESAYKRSRYPPGKWRLNIERDRRTGYVYIKMVAPVRYRDPETGETRYTFPDRQAVQEEVLKILTLMGMIPEPGAVLEDFRRPVVTSKYVRLAVRIKAYKPSERGR